MKIFQLLQRLLRMVGISSTQTLQEDPFNLKNIIILIIFVFFCIFSTIFIFFEAKTSKAFSESICISLTMYSIVLIFLEFIQKIEQLIADFESAIQKRLLENKKLNEYVKHINGWHVSGIKNPTLADIYVKVNEKVDKWTDFFYLTIVKLSPILMMPRFILTFFSYFSTDSGAEAFKLPFPMW